MPLFCCCDRSSGTCGRAKAQPLMGLTYSPVQGLCHRFNIWHDGLKQFLSWADLLFRVTEAKYFIKTGIKLEFAAPPVVVVFFALIAEEKPTVVEFSSGSHDRHPRAFSYSQIAFFFV